MQISKVTNLKNTKFILAIVLWAIFSALFYFGLLEIKLQNNVEMSLIMALAMAVLVLHLIKILKQVAHNSL